MQEEILKGRGWCMRTLQKGGMVRKDGIIKGRDDVGRNFKGEGWCMRTLQREGWCRRLVL